LLPVLEDTVAAARRAPPTAVHVDVGDPRVRRAAVVPGCAHCQATRRDNVGAAPRRCEVDLTEEREREPEPVSGVGAWITEGLEQPPCLIEQIDRPRIRRARVVAWGPDSEVRAERGARRPEENSGGRLILLQAPEIPAGGVKEVSCASLRPTRAVERRADQDFPTDHGHRRPEEVSRPWVRFPYRADQATVRVEDVHRPGVRRRRAVEWRPHRHARAGWWSERAVALEPLHRHRGSELRPRRGDTLTERLEIELGREIEGENPKH